MLNKKYLQKYLRKYYNIYIFCLYLLLLSINFLGYSQTTIYEYGDQGYCANDCVLHVLHRFGIAETPYGLFLSINDYSNDTYKLISFFDLKSYFNYLGFTAEAYFLSIDDIEKMPGEKICHYENDHFVVIEEIDEKSVIIYNPPLRINKISRQTFMEKWDGYVLIIEKTNKLFISPRYYPFPKAFIDIIYFDWGVIKSDQKLMRKIDIWNLGEEQLIINELYSSCNCTSTSLDKNIVKSGEKSILYVEEDTQGRYGKNIINIKINTNDTETPFMDLKLSCEVFRDIEAVPSKINIGMLPVGKKKKRTIGIMGTGISKEKINEIISSSNNITNILKNEYKNKLEYVGFEFEAFWINKPGIFEEKIIMSFKNNCFDPIEINITGEYQSPIRLEKEAIFFEKGKETINIQGDIQLIIEKPFQKEYYVKEVNTDIPFLKAKLRKNRYGYLIRYEGIVPKGEQLPSDGKITISGDNIPEECRFVNIYFISSGG